jgi:branched-chain amino acid transport system substrate-binding protein
MQTKLKIIALMLGAAGLASHAVQAQEKVVIGYISDLSGLYADLEGKGGATAIQMAIDDMGGKVLGQPVEVLSVDHQNKPDIAASKAREWIDTAGATMIFAGTNSGVALATAKVAQEKKRVFFTNGAATSALTNAQCSPYTVHYAYDTVALAKSTGGAVVDTGGKSWFFLTADYAFGHALEADTAKVVKAKGGSVVGTVRAPLNASDFSSFLLQAQNSKAQVLGLANAGGDFINSMKASKEFGIDKSMKVAGLLVFLTDVKSLGLPATQGLLHTTSWYWDADDESRKWAARYEAKTKNKPTDIQAADYSATMAYLNAVKAAGTDDADKVMAQLKKTPLNDFYAKGTIRKDGRYVHDMYLMQAKAPNESKGEWDLVKVLTTVPGEQAFASPADSKCPAMKG